VKALNLTPEQQAKVDPILDDMRQQMIALRSAGLPEQERQAKAQRAREAMRARIREVLTPEQQAKYDEFSGSEGGRGATAGRVWVIGPDGKAKAVAVRLGITDGTSTEVVSGDLHEGQEIIAGALGGANQPNRPSTPGAPRLRL
jgi:HlyD family secretion protein